MAKAQGLEAFTEVSLRQRLIYQICYFTKENEILFLGHVSFLKENFARVLWLGKSII